MKHFYVLAVVLILTSTHSVKSILWKVDNLDSIGGHKPTVLGNPVVIETPEGRAVLFDGKDDALIVDANPLAGARQFTVEVIFRPDTGGAREQRFLHMQEVDERRVLVETRLNEDRSWFLDTFIKSDQSERTLYAQDFLHPLGTWFHAALVYDGRQMRHYVNGAREMIGAVDYVPMQGGQTSIGCRLNRVYWFKGAIRSVRVTHRALSSSSLLVPGSSFRVPRN